VPQRERGKRRVAALLEAAASLFAEKGYDAVTMTEVAARAGAPIGSLYQFFPSKESLADALLDQFADGIDAALAEIEDRATWTVPELVDALLGLLAGFREGKAARAALIESRREASVRAAELKRSLRLRVARIVRAGFLAISPGRAERMASMLIELMKVAAAQDAEKNAATREDVLEELGYLARLYLADAAAGRGWEG
jgi:AcrR family transcriptional regulator